MDTRSAAAIPKGRSPKEEEGRVLDQSETFTVNPAPSLTIPLQNNLPQFKNMHVMLLVHQPCDKLVTCPRCTRLLRYGSWDWLITVGEALLVKLQSLHDFMM